MTCSKISLGYLPELANEIIQYFRDDYETLYSCILVNRLWCQIAIPLLWEDPFSNPAKNYRFIKFYMRKFNDDDKTKLIESGANRYDSTTSNTLFNYPCFIKSFKTQKIIHSIYYVKLQIYPSCDYNYYDYKWKKPSPEEERQRSYLIYKPLLGIFMENKVNLHTFEFVINYGYKDQYIALELINFTKPKCYS